MGFITGIFKAGMIVMLVLFIAGYLAVNWLTSMHSPGGPPGTPGQAHATQGANGRPSVSASNASNLGEVSDTLNSEPAGFPQIPTLDPAKPPQVGMIAFAYDGPLFGDDESIQKVGDGSTSYLGMGPWRPRRAGESTLFDGQAGGLDTGRAKAFILRGYHPVPFGGQITIGLRLTHVLIEKPVKCSLHVLIDGHEYAGQYHIFGRNTMGGAVETATTLDNLPPQSALDMGFAFACAGANGSMADLHDIQIDIVEKSPAHPAWKLLRPTDFVFPAGAL